MLLTTIDLRGFCSSEFPEGVDEKSRAWTFRNSPPKKTAREHLVLAKERARLPPDSTWSAAIADDPSILGKGAVYESSLHRSRMCSCVCDMCEQ